MSLVHIVEQGNLTKNEKRQVEKKEAAYERKKNQQQQRNGKTTSDSEKSMCVVCTWFTKSAVSSE